MVYGKRKVLGSADQMEGVRQLLTEPASECTLKSIHCVELHKYKIAGAIS